MQIKNLTQSGNHEVLGNGHETIAQAGCMLTSFTMAANALGGTSLSVSQANDIMRAHGGFSGSALVTGTFAKHFDMVIEKRTAQVVMDEVCGALTAGKVVVLGVDIRPGSSSAFSAADHFILAHAANPDGSIVIADPAHGVDFPAAREGGAFVVHPTPRETWRVVEAIFLTSTQVKQ